MAKDVVFNITFKGNGKEFLGKLIMESGELEEAVNRVQETVSGSISTFQRCAVIGASVNAILQDFDGLIRSISSDYSDFDKSMRAVNTMATKNAEGLEHLKNQVSALGREIPLTRDQLANGLYQTISNGVPENNWISFLEKSSKASVGGMADLGQTVTVTSTIIKNYALSWEAAGEVQDKIQLTAKNGVTSFEQLASALPRVTGNAATLGVSIDELLASFATLTGVSGNTAEVSTQLAAIFTALIKPSSEAAEMAAAMGIQFDAAAIKAAGGFRSFLIQLDQAVNAYSQKSGVLAEEIKGKLFGSAESLRALGPLMGTLSDKFSENVDAMASGAGTIDAAFSEMAGSAEAMRQKHNNAIADIMDGVGEVAQNLQPYIAYTAQLGTATTAAMTLGSGIRSVLPSVSALRLRVASLGSAAKTGLATPFNIAIRSVKVFGMAAQSAAHRTVALKLAIKGLMVTTGAGAAVAVLTFAVEKLMGAMDSAAESAGALGNATDVLNAGEEEFIRVGGETRSEMDRQATHLRVLMNAQMECGGVIEGLNAKYGDTIGTFKTAAEWIDVLTSKSAAYSKMHAYTARLTANQGELGQLQMKLDDNNAKRQEWLTANPGKARSVKDPVTGISERYGTGPEWKVLREQQNELTRQIGILTSAIEKDIRQIDKIKDDNGFKTPESPKKTDPPIITTPLVLPDTVKTSQSGLTKWVAPGSIAFLNDLIKEKNTEISLEVDPASRVRLYKELESLEAQKRHIEFDMKVSGGSKTSMGVEDIMNTRSVLPVPELPENLPEFKNPVKEEFIRDNISFAQSLDIVSRSLSSVGQAGAACGLDMMTWASQTLQATLQAIGAIEMLLPAKRSEVAANTAAAASGAAASVAAIPVVGWIMAGAAVASVIASLAALPKFADGGIAYGPTLGIFGEYSGAANNPEVVAPLNKLKDIIGLSGTGGSSTVEFKIHRKELVGILEQAEHFRGRTG